jgi:hypothetical protein
VILIYLPHGDAHQIRTNRDQERTPMPREGDLTGQWDGSYYQHDRPHPISAELVQVGEHLTGSMRDGETDTTSSVFDLAFEAGLPPGADEQIVARLREAFPDAPATPIRYLTHLPPESALEGRVRGTSLYFLKTYQGTHYGGFAVGDRLVGHRTESHSVHYGGKLIPDGSEIEGRWWIDPPPGSGERRIEGSFTLRRRVERAQSPGEVDSTSDQEGPR